MKKIFFLLIPFALSSGCATRSSLRDDRERTIQWVGKHSISGVLDEERMRAVYRQLENPERSRQAPGRTARTPSFFLVDTPGDGFTDRTVIVNDPANRRREASFIRIPHERYLPEHIIEDY